MPNQPRTCSCGRKVLWSIGVCRCGKPRLAFKVDFVALGSNLTREAYCSFLVTCQEQAPRAPVVVGCPLQVEGVKGTGTLRHEQDGTASAQGSCQLELQLSDGSMTRSNTVDVPLR